MFGTWQGYALASAFFAGLVVILAKAGVARMPSDLATLIRTAVVLLFLAVLVWVRGEGSNPASWDKKSVLFLVLSGLATGLSWACYFRALQIGPASGVASLDKLSLVFAVVMAALFLGERLGWQQWSGAALVVAGALLIALK